MAKIVKWLLVSSPNIEELIRGDRGLSEYFKDGWQPFGVINKLDDNFCQMMVKYKELSVFDIFGWVAFFMIAGVIIFSNLTTIKEGVDKLASKAEMVIK